MSFTLKKRNGKEYLYFRAGSGGTHYIMPKDSPSQVNVEGVRKSIRYMQKRMKNDKDIMERLLSYLPKAERQEFE